MGGTDARPASSRDMTSYMCPLLLVERNQFHDARSAPADEQALQKCRIGREIISLQVKTKILLATVAGRSSMDLKEEGSKTCSSKRFYLSLSPSASGSPS